MAAITLNSFKAEFNKGNHDKLADNNLVVVSGDDGKAVHNDPSDLTETDICPSSTLASELCKLGVTQASNDDLERALGSILA